MKRLFIAFLATLLWIGNTYAQNSVTPGNVRVEKSFEHIGITHMISGDVNRNSKISITFRENGTSNPLKPSAPSMRAYPGLIIDGKSTSLNYHAASVMFLKPATTYEINISLTDPDGGNNSQTIYATTKSYPTEKNNFKYVVPGSGGGDGG